MRVESIEACRTISRVDLSELINKPRSTVERMIKRGELPKPFKIGRTWHWRESTIHDWMDQKESEAMKEAA